MQASPARSAPLTRKEQVLGILRQGGYILQQNGGMLRLFDCGGREIPAWLNAMAASIDPKRMRTDRFAGETRWRMK